MTTLEQQVGEFKARLDYLEAIVLSAMPVAPLSTDDFATAAHLTQYYPLEAYDAIQLATALRSYWLLIGHQLTFTFVSGDTALIAAAQARELLTDYTFDHVSPAIYLDALRKQTPEARKHRLISLVDGPPPSITGQ